MNMQFQTSLSVEQAVRNLQAAIQEPAPAIVDLRSRLHLDGEVTRERVLLYRDQNTSTSFGRFEGYFTTAGDATQLIGHYVRRPIGFLGSRLGLYSFLALAFTVDALVRWQARHNARFFVVPTAAVITVICMFWFRVRRARIEAQMLGDTITQALSGSGA
jgi:hypothetical protein